MSLNGISTLPSKEARLEAKMGLAQGKRSGYTVLPDGTITGTPDTSANFYRVLNTYDVDSLPMAYSGNTLVDNPNSVFSLTRPWLPSTPPITQVLLTETNIYLGLEDGTVFYLE